MARRKQSSARRESGFAYKGRPPLPLQSKCTDLSSRVPDLTTAQGTRLHAMQELADILLSIFLELPAEEQAKYQTGASGGEPTVV
jgi:hypothetical protein